MYSRSTDGKRWQGRVKNNVDIKHASLRGVERVYLVSRAFIPRDIGSASREKEGEERKGRKEREGKERKQSRVWICLGPFQG